MSIKRIGSISVDTDSLIDIFSAFHSEKISENNLTYNVLLQRFLDIFKKYDIKATFFIIGKNLEDDSNSKILLKIINQGHELANHTYSHPLNFSKLSMNEKKMEIEKCHNLVYTKLGYDMKGFRAPSWDVDNETLTILENMGYDYDSSIFPSPFKFIAYLFQIYKSRKIPLSNSLFQIKTLLTNFAPSKLYHPDHKHIWRKGSMNLLEVPMSTTPIIKEPFYSTYYFILKSKPHFLTSLKKIYKADYPLNFILHTMDLYDNKKDRVPQKLKNLHHGQK